LNLTNTSVNASPTVEFGLSTKSTILNGNVAVTAVVDDTAEVELPLIKTPVDVD